MTRRPQQPTSLSINSVWPVAAVLLALGACSDQETTPASEVGKRYSQPIVAATGGTLSTTSGSARLTVPANALGADTELTLVVLAQTSETASNIFDFGPGGTAFGPAASLSIAVPADAASQRLKIARQQGERWVVLAGSRLDGGRVTGDVEHFSSFALVHADDAEPDGGIPDRGVTDSNLADAGGSTDLGSRTDAGPQDGAPHDGSGTSTSVSCEDNGVLQGPLADIRFLSVEDRRYLVWQDDGRDDAHRTLKASRIRIDDALSITLDAPVTLGEVRFRWPFTPEVHAVGTEPHGLIVGERRLALDGTLELTAPASFDGLTAAVKNDERRAAPPYPGCVWHPDDSPPDCTIGSDDSVTYFSYERTFSSELKQALTVLNAQIVNARTMELFKGTFDVAYETDSKDVFGEAVAPDVAIEALPTEEGFAMVWQVGQRSLVAPNSHLWNLGQEMPIRLGRLDFHSVALDGQDGGATIQTDPVTYGSTTQGPGHIESRVRGFKAVPLEFGAAIVWRQARKGDTHGRVVFDRQAGILQRIAGGPKQLSTPDADAWDPWVSVIRVGGLNGRRQYSIAWLEQHDGATSLVAGRFDTNGSRFDDFEPIRLHSCDAVQYPATTELDGHSVVAWRNRITGQIHLRGY